MTSVKLPVPTSLRLWNTLTYLNRSTIAGLILPSAIDVISYTTVEWCI
jgi:hypothetical protein